MIITSKFMLALLGVGTATLVTMHIIQSHDGTTVNMITTIL